MKYIVTWSEHATYKTEVTVTNAELAHWANETGILRSTTHLQNPDHIITAEEIADMQRANPAFHRAIIVLFTNKTLMLQPSESSIVSAAGQHIDGIAPGR